MSIKLRDVVGLTVTLLACSNPAGANATGTILVPSTNAVAWAAAPASLPKGTQLVVLAGDPSKPGPFVLRVKFPSNTIVAAHRHATAENLTVLTGAIYHELGEKYVDGVGKKVGPGGFVYLPPMTPHSLLTAATGTTVVQVTGTGPFGLLYVSSADDPSKKH